MSAWWPDLRAEVQRLQEQYSFDLDQSDHELYIDPPAAAANTGLLPVHLARDHEEQASVALGHHMHWDVYDPRADALLAAVLAETKGVLAGGCRLETWARPGRRPHASVLTFPDQSSISWSRGLGGFRRRGGLPEVFVLGAYPAASSR